MDLVPSDEQSEMVDSVEQFLSKELSIPQLRERLDAATGAPASAWAKAGAIGVFSLGVPEEDGGAGLPFVEECLVFRPMGRHLAPVGFIASAVAAHLAQLGGRSDVRDAVMAGEAGVAIGVARGGAVVGSRISGRFDVLDLPAAEYAVLVSAETGALAMLPADRLSGGTAGSCLDASTHLTTAALDATEADVSVEEGPSHSVYLLGCLLATAMSVGIAEAARDMGVAYAKERVQFGRPIGTNQAIKHACADMAVRAEAARSLLLFAALAVRDGRTDAPFQVASAKRVATQAAIENSRANVQIHGGMGFTWECDAHLYLSRAHLLDELFGDVRVQQRAILATAPAVP